jgi:hypothetical protein
MGCLARNEIEVMKDNIVFAMAISLLLTTSYSAPAQDCRPSINFDQRRTHLRKRARELFAIGKLPLAASNHVGQELGKIEANESAFKANDGILDEQELESLTADLHKLSKFLDKFQPLPEISLRRAELERRLNDAVGSGRLNPNDAGALKADLARLNGLEATFKDSDGGLSDEEIIELAKEYDLAAARLEKTLPALPDIFAKEAAIQTRINEAFRTGAITEDQKRDFTHEFARIRDVETAFRSSDNALSDWEAMTVAKDLDKLEAEIESSAVVPAKIRKEASAGGWQMKPFK